MMSKNYKDLIILLIERILFYLYKICYISINFLTKNLLVEKYINQKYLDLEKSIISNIDAIDFQLDEMSYHIKNSGIIDIKKITPKTTTGDKSGKSNNAYTFIDYNKESKNFEVKSEEYVDYYGESFIKNSKSGYYYIKLGDKDKNPLFLNKEYLLTITPTIGKCYTETNGSGLTGDILESLISKTKYGEGVSVDDISGNKGTATNPLNESEHRKLILDYNQRKQSTDIKVEIDKSFSTGVTDDYECIVRMLSEFCEISSIQPTFFIYNGTECALTTTYDESFVSRLTSYTGGKAYNCPPGYIRIRNGGAKEINLRVSINDLFRGANGYTTTLDDTYSCLTELVFQLEEIAQDYPIQETPDNINNINNPEIEYSDGGERYYEPWKFWFDGDLGSDSNGNPSWFKKWKSWMKEKVRVHNKWLEWREANPEKDDSENIDLEPDINAWKNDENYKRDNL